MPSDPALHLVRLAVKTPHLFTKARLLSLPVRQTDLGYVVHCQLLSLFGSFAPKPFSIESDQGRWTRVLGYSSGSGEALRTQAQSFSDPLDYSACDWETFASKPMPSTWQEGRELGFEVRICPVVRRSRGSETGGRGPEVDAFLHECSKSGDGTPVDRERVYLDWLSRELEREGAAKMLTARVIQFQRTRLLRRTGGAQRTAHVVERPDVVVTGRMQIATPEAFQRLLARGVGRHRAFGFGMLLLRPG